MIVSEIFYGLKCNRCKTLFSDSEHEFWADENSAIEYATDSDWVEIKGKHYCSSCYEYNEDEDDNVVFPEYSEHLKNLLKFINGITGFNTVVNESHNDIIIVSKRLYDRDNLLPYEEDYIKGLMGEKFISIEYVEAEKYSKRTLVVKIMS